MRSAEATSPGAAGDAQLYTLHNLGRDVPDGLYRVENAFMTPVPAPPPRRWTGCGRCQAALERIARMASAAKC